MKKYPLALKDLLIRKIPGFPDGMDAYRDFSSHINIIAGPNASGKSTTAKAIQKIIWRRETDRHQLEGDARIGDDRWKIKIDSGFQNVQRNGIDDELAGLPAAEEKNRYMLALHELISDEGEDLARRIIRESIGGYDLDEASEKRSYSSNIRTTNSGEYKNYRKADAEVQKQERIQKELKKEEQRLDDLRRNKEKAEEAERKKRLYEKLIDYLQTEEKFNRAKVTKADFPAVLKNVHGEELDQIEAFELEISQAESAIKTARKKINEQEELLNKLELPEDGISQADLYELEERVEKLTDLEKEKSELSSEIKKHETEKKEILKSIGVGENGTGWSGLNLKNIAELDQFLDKAHRTGSTLRYFEKEIEDLQQRKEEQPFDKEILQEGIKLLSQWLKETGDSASGPDWILKSIVALAVLTAVIAYFWWPFGIVGILLILLIAVYGTFKRNQREDNPREVLRIEDYKATGLTAPVSWNPDDVQQQLDELFQSLSEIWWQERIGRELEVCMDRQKELQAQLNEIEESGNELKERLSALPDLPIDEPLDYNQYYWFLKRAQAWQNAHEKQLAVEETLKETDQQYSEQLELCAELTNKYRDKAVDDAAVASSLCRDLKRLEDQRRETVNDIRQKKKLIEEKAEFKEGKENDLETIYAKLELESGSKNDVQDLIRQLDSYKKSVQEFEVCRRDLNQKQEAFERDPVYAKVDLNPEEVDQDEVQKDLDKFEAEASKLEEINREITQIETRVDSAKEGSSLETALKKRDEALEGLSRLYESNIETVTGSLLVDQLKKEIRDKNRPQVFKAANRIFNRITKGQYRIGIDEKENPQFIAYDTVKNEGLKLDQLSSGTRIQLLLSVRLAFVETQETSIKLPILADELLANCDDVRAQAIIEALAEISRDGRQVFYFTAQADEVYKWKRYLSAVSNVDYKIYDISGNAGISKYKEDLPEVESLTLQQKVPEPTGEDYDEYGKKLNVEKYHLLIHQPSGLHLWYLFDDSGILYKCLQQGIDRWGKLESFIGHGGKIEGIDEKLYALLTEKITLLQRFQDLYQQGRPKAIDRSVLERSGAVSEAFIDDVSEKLKELNGNPEDLLEALKNSEVSGFRSNKTEELENYLSNNNFIDNREPLDAEEIMVRIQALVSKLNISRKAADELIDRILS